MQKVNDNDDAMLTTFDNPFNPFDEFEIWWKTDLLLGHDCCGTLAREANTSPIFTDAVNEKYIDLAMERICRREPMTFRVVKRSDYENSPKRA